MTHKYKTSYRSHRNVKRFAVSFSGQAEPQAVKPCSICGGVVEQQPMLRDVCYTCYRDVVELQPDPRIIAAQLGATAEVMTDDSNWKDEAEAQEPVSKLQELANAREQRFNLHYYNNDGLSHFKHQGGNS